MSEIIKMALAVLMPAFVFWQTASASAAVPGHTDPAQGADAPTQRVASMEDFIGAVRAAYDHLDSDRSLDSDGDMASSQIPPHTWIYITRGAGSSEGEGEETDARQPGAATDSIRVEGDSIATDSIATDSIAATPRLACRHRFALKTNLLYWAALLPNLEAEWLIDGNWSVALDGNWAQWGSYKHEKSYRLVLIDVEGRRWIKPRAPWHGWYVGLMAGGGWYDLENGTPGHYGWGLTGGVTVGFMWPISRHLSLEAELGAGYMHTRYKDYEPIEGHHVYLRTKELDYFGPIKLKLSLVWRLPDFIHRKTTPAS